MSFLDKAVSMGAKVAINQNLHGVGHLTEFHLHLKEHTATGVIAMEGETTGIDFRIGRYDIRQKGDTVVLKVEEVTCSRKWMQSLLEKFSPLPLVTLPEKVAQAVRMAGLVEPELTAEATPNA